MILRDTPFEGRQLSQNVLYTFKTKQIYHDSWVVVGLVVDFEIPILEWISPCVSFIILIRS